MKTIEHRLLALLLVVIFVLILVIGVGASPYAGKMPITYHWQLNNGDDAYILCANGHFVVEVNGHDSIHVLCRSD